MSDLLDKWLAHYDPIHRGWTPRGIAQGVCATRGFAFPRLAGGYTLYRGPAPDGPVDTYRPVGACGPAARTVSTFDWWPMDASSDYVFALASVGGGGVESVTSAPFVRVSTDDAGDALPPAPNAPRELQAAAISGGRFELSWRYDRRDEAARPESFAVYGGEDPATIDYETVLGAVNYARNVQCFAWESSAYDHDAVRSFAVRAVSAAGAVDDNTFVVSARALATGPAVHDAVFTERVEEV